MHKNLNKLFKYPSHKHSLSLLLAIYNSEDKKLSYNEITQRFSPEPTVIRRLREMRELDLVQRQTLDEEKYRPTAYFITGKGKKIMKEVLRINEVLSEEDNK